VRTALAHRLQRLDFAVTTATNGSEALQVIEQQAFDLVLTDAVMPGISGPELVGHLRRARPELCIILMSGYTPDAVPDDELVGVQRLRKPFTAPELMRALSIAFEQAAIDQAPT
jgi:CheY-like chemotaxis protein